MTEKEVNEYKYQLKTCNRELKKLYKIISTTNDRQLENYCHKRIGTLERHKQDIYLLFAKYGL